MPCRQVSTYNGATGSGKTGGGGYATEADCNNACKEGACCEGTACTVKPQCQCQGTGKTFKGVGTTCSPNPCLCGYGTCCGPSQFVNVLGQTKYTCQQLATKSQCDAVGGAWTECGICAQCGDEKNPGPCGCDSFNPLP